MILTLKSAKNQNKTVGIKLCLISNNIIRQRFSVFLSEEAQQILKKKENRKATCVVWDGSWNY